MKRYWPLAAGLGFLLALSMFLSGAGSTPSGQPELVNIDDLSALKAEFNRSADSVRVILLLAPSCPYCLKGARVVENILQNHKDKPIAVFSVWERILPTDWSKPGTTVLHRLRDARVRQYWDADYRVASAVRQTMEARHLDFNCCDDRGVLWDMMAVFPPGAQWGDMLPEPLLVDGTVEEVAPKFTSLLETLQASPNIGQVELKP